MKKAKVLLSAISLLSIAGATVAFKANRKLDPKWYCTAIYNATCTRKSFTISVVPPALLLYCSTEVNRCTIALLVAPSE